MLTPTTELQTLLNQHPALQLISSHAQYPGAIGEGLPLLHLKTEVCEAVIALQGAQLLEFKTIGSSPLLWLSPNCNFTPGTALRGGIPICLPWFGPNEQDPKKPKHGFARNRNWALQQAKQDADGNYELLFIFHSTADALFAFDFSAQLRMTLGTSAKLELSVSNEDQRAFDCSWALHSYHPVSSLADVQVIGLAERTYLDNLEAHAAKHQQGNLRFVGEVDRVFPGVANALTIDGSPAINITHENCPSVITWNPGAENAAKIADIGAGQEQHYICVERGVVLDEKWHLEPGQNKTAWLEIRETPSRSI